MKLLILLIHIISKAVGIGLIITKDMWITNNVSHYVAAIVIITMLMMPEIFAPKLDEK